MSLSWITSTRDHEWHVGENTVQMNMLADQVIMVQADGHELQHIMENFEGLPRAHSRVVRFYGDHAKFIAGNLK